MADSYYDGGSRTTITKGTYSPSVTGSVIRLPGSGGSRSSGGSSMMSRLYGDYQSAYDEAKKANEERYNQILADLEGVGQQQEADIRSSYGNALTGMQQDLISRGLTGTTVMPSVTQSNQNSMTDALNRWREALLMQKLGFMERRTDAYPDMGMMASLAQNYGASGGGVSSVHIGGRNTAAPQAPALSNDQLIGKYGSATAAYDATGRSSLYSAYAREATSKRNDFSWMRQWDNQTLPQQYVAPAAPVGTVPSRFNNAYQSPYMMA